MMASESRWGNASHLRLGLMYLCGVLFLALSLPVLLEPMLYWTGIIFGGYEYPTHEVHHFVLGIVLISLLLGIISQAYRPSDRPAALHSSIIIWGWFTIFFTIGDGFEPMFVVLLGLLIAMALFHPAGSSQLPEASSFSRPFGYLAILTAVLAFGFAGNELLTHLNVTDAHVSLSHYLFMATAAASVGTLLIRGSFSDRDWRYPIYLATAFIVIFGLASIVYPGAEQGSSAGQIGGAICVLWAGTLLIIAERGKSLLE